MVISQSLYPRYMLPRLREALADSPVVLIHGPRQCGKSTLAQTLSHAVHPGRRPSNIVPISNPGPISSPIVPLPASPPTYAAAPHGNESIGGYVYHSFDDDVLREAAQEDPVGFVSDLPEWVILDEVQRVPGLFTSIKLNVDRNRTPGRFVLTGSTNLFLLPQLSESLAGRIQIVRLHPLAQRELMGGGIPTNLWSDTRPGFLDDLFDGGFKSGQTTRLRDGLAERITAGGYVPAMALPSGRRRANWYRDYVETLVLKDVREMSRIRRLDELPRLLEAATAQTACLFNQDSLSRVLRITRPTVADYVALLERAFLLERLPAWSTNRSRRLVKTAKLHIGDTGVGCALLGIDAWALAADRRMLGQFVETFVYQELRKQACWYESHVSFHYYRDKDGAEVDIVIEKDGAAIAGIEVKAGATVTSSDFKGLRKLARVCEARFRIGVVLYDGEATVRFGEGLYAVPIRRLWERP